MDIIKTEYLCLFANINELVTNLVSAAKKSQEHGTAGLVTITPFMQGMEGVQLTPLGGGKKKARWRVSSRATAASHSVESDAMEHPPASFPRRTNSPQGAPYPGSRRDHAILSAARQCWQRRFAN